MSFRLVALDIDGTLLDPRSELRPATVRAVSRVRARGVHVVLATGRRFRSTLRIAEQLGLENHAAVFNGTVVKDLGSRRTVSAEALTPDVVRDCVETLRQAVAPLAYLDSDCGDDDVDILTEPHHALHPMQRDYLDSNRSWARTVDDVAGGEFGEVLMLASIGDRETLTPVRRQLEESLAGRAEIRFLFNPPTDNYFLEVLAGNTSKWKAVERIAAGLGVPAEAVIAIGDDTNDLEMIRAAGMGVAMGNAHAEVLEAADWVTESNADDGVASALETLIA